MENACASSSFQAEDVTRKGEHIETAAKKYIDKEKMKENVLYYQKTRIKRRCSFCRTIPSSTLSLFSLRQ